jgi:hypothetical protein
MWNGFSQAQLGLIETAGWLPVPTRIRATTENTSSIRTSTPSRTRCSRADTSMPR